MLTKREMTILILLKRRRWTLRKSIALILLLRHRRRRDQQKRRYWVHPIYADRKSHGFFYVLLPQLIDDDEKFFNFMRMGRECFNTLLSWIGPRLKKKSFRESISPGERLMVTLRFLATGDSFRSLAFQFRIAQTTITNIIREVCEELANELARHVQLPTTPEEWEKIANEFYQKWQMPNCVGSIDGKHVAIKKPAHSGSLYYNYKGFFSLVLLAVCDANYRILYVHYGSYGNMGDAGIFGRSDFAQQLNSGTLNLPNPKMLPGTDFLTPFFFVGDGAFPLQKTMMKPFGIANLNIQQRAFNYRLSRSRRVIENVFGIMACKWRILLRPIETKDETADFIIRAIVGLHNFLIEFSPANRNPALLADHGLTNAENGRWREEVPNPLHSVRARGGARRFTTSAMRVRDNLMTYFNTVGRVDWQDNYI